MRWIMKKVLVFLFGLSLLCFVPFSRVDASSAMISLSGDKTELAVGESVTVSCVVSSSDKFSAIDTYLTYDNEYLEFIEGSDETTGGAGIAHVKISEKKAIKTRTVTLTFRAIKAGDATVGLSGEASVTNAKGKKFSTSSNRFAITVTGTGDEAEPIIPTENLSSDNNLVSLKIDQGNMSPLFQQGTTKYEATVDCQTSILYFSYQTSDPDAIVSFKNNENLVEGDNKVQVIVRAANGNKKKYTINVYKETKEETDKRVAEEEGNNKQGLTFALEQRDGQIFLENSYQFKVVDISEQTQVPTGYIKSKVSINGVEVPTYTMQNNLDSDFLLFYLANEAGEEGFYQYDRKEKTLQRYTGTMTEKVNEFANTPVQETSSSSLKYIVIIAILIVIVLVMLVAMLKLLSSAKKRRKSSKKTEVSFDSDDLDFL